MSVREPSDSMPPPANEGGPRSARKRQRRGPMLGCLLVLARLFAVALLVVIVVIVGGWWYVGSTSFAGLIRTRIVKTLEARLGRDVSIGSIEIIRTAPQKVILNDLRIANAPGGVAPDFATVRQVEITANLESFWNRRVNIERVDVRDPRISFEVFPEGSPLAHNFPKWNSGPPSKYEIVHVAVGRVWVSNGAFSFLDRKHDISAMASRIGSRITVTRAEDLYEGIVASPNLEVRLQDYRPFETKMRGDFRYTPGVLDVRSIALHGQGIEADLSGKIDPITDGVYDIRIDSRVGLDRVRQIFSIEKALEGTMVLDARLSGREGEFHLAGGWSSPRIVADTYQIANPHGRLDVQGGGGGEKLTVDVVNAGFGGGSIGAHYELGQYSEPYPMQVDLRYGRVSIEQLFADWGFKNSGLHSAATGTLTYRWNKDLVLDGSGQGTAKLAGNPAVSSRARYPIPISGVTDFSLDRGTVKFRKAELDTESSHISLGGALQIENVVTDLTVKITSEDLAEVDRLGYDFAHAADKSDYELLGLGGAGTIKATVHGPIDKPRVVATMNGTATRYNDTLLGDSDIALHYESTGGGILTFDRAAFTNADATLSLAGTIGFPEEGDPRFDISAKANAYPAESAIAAAGLDFHIGPGLATGGLDVAGTPDSGTATFQGLTVCRDDASLSLKGGVSWFPGEGNVSFDLDIDADAFPVADVATFFELGDIPITGKLTGELQLRGPKESLEGNGTVTVRGGSIFEEPIDLASATIAFEKGKMRAANVLVQSPAGEIRGEGDVDLTAEQFDYSIESKSIELSKLANFESLRGLLGGKLVLNSTGSGTFSQPELTVQATIEEGTLSGVSLPAGSGSPSLHLEVRNGHLAIRGSIADIATIEGDGTVGNDLTLKGVVRVTINDLARAAALSTLTSTIPVSGKVVLDLDIGGKLSPIEALVVQATVPVLDLKVADREYTKSQPLRVTLRDGRIDFDSFSLNSPGSSFTVTGYAEIAGAQRLDVGVKGRLETAILQLFTREVRSSGIVDVGISIGGTMGTPRIVGAVGLNDAQVKFAGFPQLIDEINGTIRFRGDRIEIESVRALVGGGTVVASGYVALEGAQPRDARITLQGRGVAIRYYQGLTVEGNFTLLLTGGAGRSLLQGDVDVTRALYFRDFDVQQTLLKVILARNRALPGTAATWQDRVGLRIHLSAPGTLAVSNNIAEVTGSADLDVTGTVANPVILGEVTLDEGGTMSIQNVDYRVVRGTIAFQNPFRIDPFLDLTIEGTVSGFGASETEAGPYEVTVNVTGTLDRLTPSITSDPPASDITLFSILGLGGLASAPGTPNAGVGLVGQSLLYSSIGSLIGSRVFPFVDSFAYDPGTLDTGAGAGAKVTFEKRLSNKIRFLLVYNLENNQSRQVMEWLVNSTWTLQLTRDESDEYRLDARFRRRYPAHWELGNDEASFAKAAVMKAEGPAVRTTVGATVGTPAIPTAGATGATPAPKSPAPPVTAVNARAAEGLPVSRINFRADAAFDTSTLAQEVTLAPGKPVTIRETQSSIKNLFATGNFRDIRVDAAKSDGGVVVTFSLFLHYRIRDIAIEGLDRKDRTRVERELKVHIDDILSLDAVDDSAAAIEDKLHENGYLEATVDPETNFDRARNSADVAFHATPGPKAKVANVILEGELAPFNAKQLIHRMKRGPGKDFHLLEARADAGRIKNFLVRRDYRRARLDLVDEPYDKATHSVTLHYRVQVGPLVKVAVEGVPRRMVRHWLPFARNQEYSEDAVDQAADQIVEGLQRRGYYLATVDTESNLEDHVWTTTFHVDPGAQFKLEEVVFTGNQKVGNNELQKVVQTSPRRGIRGFFQTLFHRPTGVTEGQLRDDRDSVESYYRLNGFSEATVDTPVVDTQGNGTMRVELPVTEGPQTILADVHIEGNQKIGTGDLPRPKLEEGKPLNPQLLRDDVIALQTDYAKRGYAEVQVSPRVGISDDKTTAHVTYAIVEGPQVRVDQVTVRGNTYTDRDVVLRKSGLDSGDPFSYTSMLEAQRDLYRLGIFQRVEVQPQEVGTEPGKRDIVMQVEEGRDLTVTGSVGLRADRGPDVGSGTEFHERLSGAIAHRNLFGTGRYLGLEGVFSRDQQEAFLTYREPFITRWNLPVQLQIFQSNDSTRSGATIQQRGMSVETNRVFALNTRLSLRYEYRISECVEGELCRQLESNTPVEGLDPSLRSIQISSITPTFFWDRRDDILDPHRGFFTSASVEYAFPLFAADAGFFKEYVQGAFYLPLTERSVLALSGRAGMIQPYARGDIDDDGIKELLAIALSERFTAGGETSHRAFPPDRLGDLCLNQDLTVQPGCVPTLLGVFDDSGKNLRTILPLGGNSMFVFNAEYRFPIFGTFGGAVFADIGNVFAGSQIHFDDLRYGTGIGFRYLSPVGPLRLDIGIPLHRRWYEDTFQYFFTLGYAF